ncbi:hypothetical protein [Kocuria sp. CH-021]|uniref:hypothetical protein n=1 Tax=Kocuria sp. CH-021 TaxID=3406735 RepID=UPI003C73B283
MTGLALGLAVVASAPASAAEQTINLRLIGSPHVSDGDTLTVLATNVPKETLTTACFNFTFTDDLVDPGEGLTIITADSGNGPGFFNPTTESQATRTLCIEDPSILEDIADGNSAERFVIQAMPGSTFTVSSVSLTLTTA